MKLGTENKKSVYALIVLGVVAAYLVYSNLLSDSSGGSAPRPSVVAERNQAADVPPPATSSASPNPVPPRQLAAGRSKGDEFHPTLRSKRKEEQIDPLTVDPTLRLDLLAKVQAVKLDGGQRNLFQFGKMEPVAVLKGPEAQIIPKREAMGPPVAPPPPPPPPPVTEAPPPPFPMKYYGLATKRIDNKKTAFFLDGEEPVLATEGMVVKQRYKVMRINNDSVVIQDTQAKRDQTVKLSEDAGGTA